MENGGEKRLILTRLDGSKQLAGAVINLTRIGQYSTFLAPRLQIAVQSTTPSILLY